MLHLGHLESTKIQVTSFSPVYSYADYMKYFEPLRVSIAKISNLDSGLNINKTEPNRKVISEKKTRESILAH